MTHPPGPSEKIERPRYEGTLGALRRLDDRLQRALDAAVARNGQGSLADPFRGLYLSAEQVTRPADLRDDGDTLPPLAPGGEPGWDTLCQANPLWDWLRSAFGLSPFDLDLVLIALAPEVERHYERIYAYLQDDVSREAALRGSGARPLLHLGGRKGRAARPSRRRCPLGALPARRA